MGMGPERCVMARQLLPAAGRGEEGYYNPPAGGEGADPDAAGTGDTTGAAVAEGLYRGGGYDDALGYAGYLLVSAGFLAQHQCSLVPRMRELGVRVVSDEDEAVAGGEGGVAACLAQHGLTRPDATGGGGGGGSGGGGGGAVLVRPDRYVLGTAADAAELEAMLAVAWLLQV